MDNIGNFIRSKLDQFKQSVNAPITAGGIGTNQPNVQPYVNAYHALPQPIQNFGNQVINKISNTPLFTPLSILPGAGVANTPMMKQMSPTIGQYVQGQIVNPAKNVLNPKTPLLGKALSGLQTGFNLTPAGTVFNLGQGALSGSIRSLRTGQPLDKSVSSAIANPSGLGTTGLGMTGLPALALDVAGSANPEAISSSLSKGVSVMSALKGINPKAFSMHPDDIEEAKSALDILRGAVSATKEDKAYAMQSVQHLLEGYAPGYKYSTNEKAYKVLENLIQTNEKLPQELRTPMPAMGLVGKTEEPVTQLKAITGGVGEPVEQAKSLVKNLKAKTNEPPAVLTASDQAFKNMPTQDLTKKLSDMGYLPEQIAKINRAEAQRILDQNIAPFEHSTFPQPAKELPIKSAEDITREAGTAQSKAFENKDDFNKILAKYIGKGQAARTTGTQVGAQFKDIPQDLTSDVIRAVENPSAEVNPSAQSFVKPIRAQYDQLFKDAQKNGIDMNYIENYLTHYWKASEPEVKQAYAIFKQREGFQNERVLPTYEEGIKMGLTPKYTHPAQILTEYATRLERLKNNLDFFKKLQGEGFIVDSSVGAKHPGFVPLTGPGFPRSITRGPDGTIYQGTYFAPPEIATKINQLFSPSNSPTILKVASKASRLVQDVTLSGGIPGTPLNAFTVAQAQKELLAGRVVSPLTAFVRSMSEGSSLKFFENNAEQIKKMQERNIPISSSFDIGHLVGTDKGNLWNRAVNDPTFKRFMPQLQINLFNDIEKQALRGGSTPAEAADIAASAVKKFYGVIPSDKEALASGMGRDLKSTFLFAPKFRESMVNFWKENVKALAHPTAFENRTNIKFLAGTVLTLGAMDYLNNSLNGHHMWQNPTGKEDKLLIPVGNGTVIGIPFLSSIATVPRGIAREGMMIAKGDLSGAAVDAGSTYTSSLVKPFFDIARNADYFGKEIVSPGDDTLTKFKKEGTYLGTQFISHPYIKETLDPRNSKDPAYQRISRALELPLRYYSQKSIDSAPYFSSLNNAINSITDPNEKNIFMGQIHPQTKDSSGNSIIDKNVYTTPAKYETFLAHPKLLQAEIAFQKTQPNHDPFWDWTPAQQKAYMQAQIISKNNPGGDKTTVNALYSAIPQSQFDARTAFFNNLVKSGQIPAQSQGQYTVNTPPEVSKFWNDYFKQPQGSAARKQMIQSPIGQQALALTQQKADLTNQQRLDMGLPLLNPSSNSNSSSGSGGYSSSQKSYIRRTIRQVAKPRPRKAPFAKLPRPKKLSAKIKPMGKITYSSSKPASIKLAKVVNPKISKLRLKA